MTNAPKGRCAMKKKKHISAGRVTADDVVSAIRFQDIYPEDFNTRRRKYEAVLSAIDDALEGWKVPREVLSREQEARLAAYARRLMRRRDKVAAKLIQISAEEDNFDAIIRSFHALPEDDRTILQEMIFLGVKGANVSISRGCRTDRTVWRHRKAALDRIVEDCSRKRGALA